MFESDADLLEQSVWDEFWNKKIKELLNEDAQQSAENILK